MRPRQRLRRECRRTGAVLVVALVCLFIVMSLLGGMLKGALRERRQLGQQRDLRQTELLLEAGVDRARFAWPPTPTTAVKRGACRPRKSSTSARRVS